MQQTPDFDPAKLAKSLLRRSRQGALATLMTGSGDPYCSLVNVASAPDVLEAIRQCWVSLWTERALRYRHERSIEHHGVAMAVVVQSMVPAEAAGVLFTVDPIAHRRDRLYVEAAATGRVWKPV